MMRSGVASFDADDIDYPVSTAITSRQVALGSLAGGSIVAIVCLVALLGSIESDPRATASLAPPPVATAAPRVVAAAPPAVAEPKAAEPKPVDQIAAIVDPRAAEPARSGARVAAVSPAPAAPAVVAPPQPPKRTVDVVAAPLPPANPFRGKSVAETTVVRPVPAPVAGKPPRAPQTPRRAVENTTHEEQPNFFQKLFGGLHQSQGPELAYARADESAVGGALSRNRLAPRPAPTPALAQGRTAVYDISARTVFLPNGKRLEAHSGLGPLIDDPRHVHQRNRGATPPKTYDLTLREKLFHGVQALRLTPSDGKNPYGRDGLLAHSFMLGPNGDSNGCVSFRDYPEFLNAFMRGEVNRLVVVARQGDVPSGNTQQAGLAND